MFWAYTVNEMVDVEAERRPLLFWYVISGAWWLAIYILWKGGDAREIKNQITNKGKDKSDIKWICSRTIFFTRSNSTKSVPPLAAGPPNGESRLTLTATFLFYNKY